MLILHWIMNDNKTVLVFGTFDALHPGHEYFLEKAANLGDRLVVVVARDRGVRLLKNRSPLHKELSRLHFVQSHPLVHQAVLADEQMGSFIVVQKIRPRVICLGHDQSALWNSLKSWMEKNNYSCEIKHLKPFKREQYSSTLLNKLRQSMKFEDD